MNQLAVGTVVDIVRDGTGESFRAEVLGFAKNPAGQPVAVLRAGPGTLLLRDVRTGEMVSIGFVSVGTRYEDFPVEGPFDKVLPVNLVRLREGAESKAVISPGDSDEMGRATLTITSTVR